VDSGGKIPQGGGGKEKIVFLDCVGKNKSTSFREGSIRRLEGSCGFQKEREGARAFRECRTKLVTRDGQRGGLASVVKNSQGGIGRKRARWKKKTRRHNGGGNRSG